MRRLGLIVKAICDLNIDKVEYKYDEICSWWQFIREIILECPCALRGLVFAIVCKHVSKGYLLIEDNEVSFFIIPCISEISNDVDNHKFPRFFLIFPSLKCYLIIFSVVHVENIFCKRSQKKKIANKKFPCF